MESIELLQRDRRALHGSDPLYGDLFGYEDQGMWWMMNGATLLRLVDSGRITFGNTVLVDPSW